MGLSSPQKNSHKKGWNNSTYLRVIPVTPVTPGARPANLWGLLLGNFTFAIGDSIGDDFYWRQIDVQSFFNESSYFSLHFFLLNFAWHQMDLVLSEFSYRTCSRQRRAGIRRFADVCLWYCSHNVPIFSPWSLGEMIQCDFRTFSRFMGWFNHHFSMVKIWNHPLEPAICYSGWPSGFSVSVVLRQFSIAHPSLWQVWRRALNRHNEAEHHEIINTLVITINLQLTNQVSWELRVFLGLFSRKIHKTSQDFFQSPSFFSRILDTSFF